MAKVFKEKAPQVRAVEFISIPAQLNEVADLIKAETYNVDLANKQATFYVEGEPTSYTVKQGEVISVSDDGVVKVDTAESFYLKYERVS